MGPLTLLFLFEDWGEVEMAVEVARQMAMNYPILFSIWDLFGRRPFIVTHLKSEVNLPVGYLIFLSAKENDVEFSIS